MKGETTCPADGQVLEVVREQEGLPDDVAKRAQALDVAGALAGDHGQDAAPKRLAPVGVAVAALAAQKCAGVPARTSLLPGDGRNSVDHGSVNTQRLSPTIHGRTLALSQTAKSSRQYRCDSGTRFYDGKGDSPAAGTPSKGRRPP